MINIYQYCILQGDYFSPSLAEAKTGITFSKKNEPGDVGNVGRYRGKSIPYGSAEIIALNEKGNEDSIDFIVNILDKYCEVFRLCGADNIVLHFVISYIDQCDFEFSPEFINKLAKLKIVFAITCYPETDASGEYKP